MTDDPSPRSRSIDLADVRDERMVEELTARGWHCVRDKGQGWETPAQFSRRMGRNKNYFASLMKRGAVPAKMFEETRTKAGRLTMIRPTPELVSWIQGRQGGDANLSISVKNLTPCESIRLKSAPKSTSAAFERFWSEYPKHVAKMDAQKAWLSMKCEPIAEKIIAAVARCKQCTAWTKDRGEFVPYPATWLRRAGWEDELGPIHRHGTLPEKDMPKVMKFG